MTVLTVRCRLWLASVLLIVALGGCDRQKDETSVELVADTEAEAAAEGDTGQPDNHDSRDAESEEPEVGSAETPALKVFVLAGQSNMVGLGKVAELSDEQQQPVDRALIWLDDSVHMSPRRKRWAPLEPGYGVNPQRFGPELALGRRIGEAWPERPFAIIKVAEGGTNLYFDWNAREGRLYKRLVGDVRRQMEALEERWRPEIVGMVWMQGESDARPPWAGNYRANLKEFLTTLREDLKTPDLPTVIGLIAPIDLWAAHETIRGAQRAVAESLSNTAVVDTADVPRHADDPAHYDTEGQLRLGEAFAEALLEFVE